MDSMQTNVLKPNPEARPGDVTDIVKKNYKRTNWVIPYIEWVKIQKDHTEPYKK